MKSLSEGSPVPSWYKELENLRSDIPPEESVDDALSKYPVDRAAAIKKLWNVGENADRKREEPTTVSTSEAT